MTVFYPAYVLAIFSYLGGLGLMILTPSLTLAMQLNPETQIEVNREKTFNYSLQMISSPSLNSYTQTTSLESFQLLKSSGLSTNLINYDVATEFNKNWQQQVVSSQASNLLNFPSANSETPQPSDSALEIPEPDLIIGLKILGLSFIGAVLRKLK